MHTNCKGLLVFKFTKGAALSGDVLLRTQRSQVLTLASTACDIFGQKNLDLTRSRVLSIPRLPISS